MAREEVAVPRERGRKVVATNRKARHDYHIEAVYEAGLVLVGTEVKSLRAGRASLVDGYATVSAGEVWLENVHIPEYAQGTWTNHEPRRRRKLLLHRDEIDDLGSKIREKGLTLVPLALYFSDGRAKVELGLARGKRSYDKRQALRERQDRREADRAMSLRAPR
jgi:SsrA-binding protein